jgi:hypothetical protein
LRPVPTLRRKARAVDAQNPHGHQMLFLNTDLRTKKLGPAKRR